VDTSDRPIARPSQRPGPLVADRRPARRV